MYEVVLGYTHGDLVLGLKDPQPEADCYSHQVAEVKNKWSFTSNPYAASWEYVKLQREN
jgi:hypothetical protein